MRVLPEQVRLGMDELRTHIVVLYDGVCGLCNRLNQLLLTRDSADRFRFAPLQSQFASRVLARHGIDPGNLDTVYVLLEIGGVWSVMGGFFGILPKGLRNWLYDLGASHRYQLFGKDEVCPIPL